jgi:hypothetical protein
MMEIYNTQNIVNFAKCGRAGRPARPRTQHDCHHDKVKPDAATAVIELLMMGGKTPETYWAVNKRQNNKLKIFASGWWFIWIVRCCIDLQSLNFSWVNLYRRPNDTSGTRGGAFDWGTALQAGSSRVRFTMVSFDFFIVIILPAALWPWVWLSL